MAAWQSLIPVNGQTKVLGSPYCLIINGQNTAVMGYLWGYSLSSKPTLIIHSIAALNIKCFDRDKWKKNLHHLHCFLFFSFTKTSINFSKKKFQFCHPPWTLKWRIARFLNSKKQKNIIQYSDAMQVNSHKKWFKIFKLAFRIIIWLRQGDPDDWF